MTITAPRSDQTTPPDGSAVLLAPAVGSESVNAELHAQQNVVIETEVLPGSAAHTATGLVALSDVTDDFVRLADVLATLTAANHSQGSAATIEALRPAELLPPEVQYPWTEPHTLTTPGLPAALRRIPTHAVQLKRRLARRHAPKINFLVFFLLFVSILVVFARITSYQRTPFNYFLSVVWSVYAPLIVLGLIGAFSLRREQRRGRRSAGEDASDVPMSSATAVSLRRRRNKPLRSEYTGRSSRLLVVTVPSLLAKGNQPALERVLHSLLLNLPVYFDRFHVDVITEGDVDVQPLQDWIKRCGRMGEPIRIVNVPVGLLDAPRCSIQNAGQPVRHGGAQGSGGEHRGLLRLPP